MRFPGVGEPTTIGAASQSGPDLFDVKKAPVEQYQRLPEVMIRNNKANVTDLEGRPLFQPVTVLNREYSFSEAEETFYGNGSATFINGDERLDGLLGPDGRIRSLMISRDNARPTSTKVVSGFWFQPTSASTTPGGGSSCTASDKCDWTSGRQCSKVIDPSTFKH